MRNFWKWGICIVIIACIAVVGVNYISFMAPIRSVLAEDPRNRGLAIWAYHPYGIVWTEVVFDVRELPDSASCADVTRTFLQFAARLRGRSFSEIYIASKGSDRFILPGSDFQTIGQEYDTQNPVYTLRTLPEKLHLPNGTPAFSTWTGGMIGVLGQQMQDLTDFCRRWLAPQG